MEAMEEVYGGKIDNLHLLIGFDLDIKIRYFFGMVVHLFTVWNLVKKKKEYSFYSIWASVM